MLTGSLDAETAERVRARLRELGQRGCERLIVDVSAAGELDRVERALLARVLEARPAECEVVVVTDVRRSALAAMLAEIPVTWSLSAARALLARDTPSREGRERPGPGAMLSSADHHLLAVRQALRWAERTAGAGDYESALRALVTIERIEGSLPQGWHERRQAWLAEVGERDVRVPPSGGGGIEARWLPTSSTRS